MRRLPAIAAVGITVLGLVNVSAQDEKDVGLSRDYDACMEKSGGVTSSRNRTPRGETKWDLQRDHGAVKWCRQKEITRGPTSVDKVQGR